MKYLAIITGYMLGSIPFGYLVSKYWKGINILEHGSGNIGFTNVLRVVGWPPATLVLLGDITKGAFAAWIGMKVGGETYGIFCSMAAMLGHSYSMFLKFRGGKLVATALGVLLMLASKVALVAVLVWLVTLFLSKYVSLASIVAAFSVLPAMFWFGESLEIKVFLGTAVVFVIFKHRGNVVRLMQGTEYKIGQRTGK